MSAKKKINVPVIRSVKFNVIMNMILTSSSFLFPLITVPYVSRVLRPSGMGLVSWAQSYAVYFSTIALLGIGTYGVKVCAAVRSDREKLSQVVQELATILFISTTCVYIGYIGILFAIPKAKDNLPLMLAYSLCVWLSSFSFEWLYQSIEQYGYITVRSIAFKFIGLILIFIFVRSPADFLAYGIINVIGSYGSNIFNLIRLRRFVDFKLHRKLNLKEHLKSMVSYTISAISISLYTQMGIFFTGLLLSNTATGLYQLVVKIDSLGFAVTNSVASVMLPRFSYYVSHAKSNKIRSLVGKNFNFLAIIGIFLITTLVFCGRPIIQILGGDQYLGARIPLAIISPFIVVTGINSILQKYLVANGKEKPYAFVTATNCVTCALFCILLIPKLGIIGSALSELFAGVLQMLMSMFVIRDFLKDVFKETDFPKIIFAGALAIVTAFLLTRFTNATSPFIQAIVILGPTLIVYCSLLLLTKEKFIYSILDSYRKKIH